MQCNKIFALSSNQGLVLGKDLKNNVLKDQNDGLQPQKPGVVTHPRITSHRMCNLLTTAARICWQKEQEPCLKAVLDLFPNSG